MGSHDRPCASNFAFIWHETPGGNALVHWPFDVPHPVTAGHWTECRASRSRCHGLILKCPEFASALREVSSDSFFTPPWRRANHFEAVIRGVNDDGVIVCCSAWPPDIGDMETVERVVRRPHPVPVSSKPHLEMVVYYSAYSVPTTYRCRAVRLGERNVSPCWGIR